MWLNFPAALLGLVPSILFGLVGVSYIWRVVEKEVNLQFVSGEDQCCCAFVSVLG